MTHDELQLFDMSAVETVAPVKTEADDTAKQLRTMHQRHGVVSGRTCGECVHLWSGRYNTKTYFKCGFYTPWTHGPRTDWRKKWTACGKFEAQP